MGSLGNTYENHALDALLGSAHSSTFPDPVWIAGVTAEGTDSAVGVEPSAGAYGRVEMANDDTSWPDAAGSVKANGAEVLFPTATADWGEIVGWEMWDDETATAEANRIMYGTLAEGIVINTGDRLVFDVGAITIGGD